jgi:hypothetical protein
MSMRIGLLIAPHLTYKLCPGNKIYVYIYLMTSLASIVSDRFATLLYKKQEIVQARSGIGSTAFTHVRGDMPKMLAGLIHNWTYHSP